MSWENRNNSASGQKGSRVRVTKSNYFKPTPKPARGPARLDDAPRFYSARAEVFFWLGLIEDKVRLSCHTICDWIERTAQSLHIWTLLARAVRVSCRDVSNEFTNHNCLFGYFCRSYLKIKFLWYCKALEDYHLHWQLGQTTTQTEQINEIIG